MLGDLLGILLLAGSYDDLHLVAWESKCKTAVKLLCGGCRAVLSERFTLNVPLPLLSLAALTQLEAQGQLPPGAAVVRTLREAFTADLSATWEAFRRLPARRQGNLGFTLHNELPLT